MGLIPLTQFICDECGEIIRTPQDGWFEWLHLVKDSEVISREFRIVHHAPASPRRSSGGNCQYRSALPVADMHLEHCLGPDGLAILLSLFARTPAAHQPALIESVRRLQIPHYEEARQYWSAAQADGYFDAHEYRPYLQETLTELIERYGTHQVGR